MAVWGLVTVVIGIIAFVIVEGLITNVITGTDIGSMIIQNLLRVIIASGIIISVVIGLGRRSK